MHCVSTGGRCGDFGGGFGAQGEEVEGGSVLTPSQVLCYVEELTWHL